MHKYAGCEEFAERLFGWRLGRKGAVTCWGAWGCTRGWGLRSATPLQIVTAALCQALKSAVPALPDRIPDMAWADPVKQAAPFPSIRKRHTDHSSGGAAIEEIFATPGSKSQAQAPRPSTEELSSPEICPCDCRDRCLVSHPRETRDAKMRMAHSMICIRVSS